MCVMLERTQHFFSFAEKAYTQDIPRTSAEMDRAVESKNCMLHTVDVLEQYVLIDTSVVVQVSQDQQYFFATPKWQLPIKVLLLFLQKSLDTSIQIIAKFLRTSDIWEHICCILSSPQFHDEVHSHSYYNLKKTTYIVHTPGLQKVTNFHALSIHLFQYLVNL